MPMPMPMPMVILIGKCAQHEAWRALQQQRAAWGACEGVTPGQCQWAQLAAPPSLTAQLIPRPKAIAIQMQMQLQLQLLTVIRIPQSPARVLVPPGGDGGPTVYSRGICSYCTSASTGDQLKLSCSVKAALLNL